MGNLFSKKKADTKAPVAIATAEKPAAAPAATPAAGTTAVSAAEPTTASLKLAVGGAAAPATPAKTPAAASTPMSPVSVNTKATHKPIVLCGPSGVGKGTLTQMLFMDFPSNFSRKISHTTRAARADEVNGVSYYFVDRETFEADIEANRFVEHANVHGNYYGTAISSVESAMKAGKIVILELDIQGVQTVRASGALECNFIWVAPPNYDELLARLSNRGTESEDVIKTRLETATKERETVEAHPELFDFTLVNDDLKAAYGRLTQLIAEQYTHMADDVAAHKANTAKQTEHRESKAHATEAAATATATKVAEESKAAEEAAAKAAEEAAAAKAADEAAAKAAEEEAAAKAAEEAAAKKAEEEAAAKAAEEAAAAKKAEEEAAAAKAAEEEAAAKAAEEEAAAKAAEEEAAAKAAEEAAAAAEAETEAPKDEEAEAPKAETAAEAEAPKDETEAGAEAPKAEEAEAEAEAEAETEAEPETDKAAETESAAGNASKNKKKNKKNK